MLNSEQDLKKKSDQERSIVRLHASRDAAIAKARFYGKRPCGPPPGTITPPSIIRDIWNIAQFPSKNPQVDYGDLLNIWSRYTHDPVKFVTEILGAFSYTGKPGPDPGQCQVLDALVENRLVCMRTPHGFGKTALCAFAVHWYLCTHFMSKIPICAPTFGKQIKGMIFSEIHSWARKSLLREMLNMTVTKMSIVGAENEWFAEGIAAEDPDKVEGYHAPGGILYVFDEAKGVHKKIWDAARAALTGPEDRFLVVSTPPLIPIGEFVRVFTHLRSTWKTFAYGPNPRQSAAWRKEREKEWPVGSAEHTAKILGQIPSSNTDSTIISLKNIEEAMERIPKDSDYVGSSKIGVDVARLGGDETVFAVRKGNVVLPLEIFTKQDTAISSLLLEELLDFYDRAAIDEIGIGAGIIDPISHHETKASKLDVIQANSPSSDPEKYADLTTEMWFHFAEMLPSLFLPTDDILATQLATREFIYIWKKGRMVRKLQSKEDMRKKNIQSPDRADAVISACVEVAPIAASLSTNEIDEIQNPFKPHLTPKMNNDEEIIHGLFRNRQDNLREIVQQKIGDGLTSQRSRFWRK